MKFSVLQSVNALNLRNLLRISSIFLFLFMLGSAIGQGTLSHLKVDGNWSGNDANGNAIIKWSIQVCTTGPLNDVRVFAPYSGANAGSNTNGSFAGDEDTPHSYNNSGELSTCNDMNWSAFNGGNIGGNPPAPNSDAGGSISQISPNGGLNFQQMGFGCAQVTWTTHSKDYDSSNSDFDHFVVAEACVGCAPSSLSFDCNTGPDSPVDGCSASLTENNSVGACVNLVDCQDVATNNYEQILGLAINHEETILHKEGYIETVFAYVACHHGESDGQNTEAGSDFDLTEPGPNVPYNITPDNITNIVIQTNEWFRVKNRNKQLQIDSVRFENPNEVFLDAIYPLGTTNPQTDNTTFWQNITTGTSTLPVTGAASGDIIDDTNGILDAAACGTFVPVCDTLYLHSFYTPGFSGETGQVCDTYSNIQSRSTTYEPENGYQNVSGGADDDDGIPESPPEEKSTNGYDPDPEFGHCGSSSAGTCAAGPGEDCSGESFTMCCEPASIQLTKTVVSVQEDLTNPDLYIVEFELVVTNPATSDFILTNVDLEDPIASCIPGSVVDPATIVINPAVVPSTCVLGGGFPTPNMAYDGLTGSVPDLTDGTGSIDPGASMQVNFVARVPYQQLNSGNDTNKANVSAEDPNDNFVVPPANASAEIPLPNPDLALIKDRTATDPVSPGEDVTYTITVENQGDLAMDSFKISDYIPAGMSFNAALSPAGWVANGDTICYLYEAAPGDNFEPMEQFSVDIVLTANYTATPYPSDWINIAEISQMWDTLGLPRGNQDIDSQLDTIPGNDLGGLVDSAADDVWDGDGTGAGGPSDPNTDEDDSDPEGLPYVDFALTKTTSQTDPVKYGQLVPFTITITNQGNVAGQNFVISDYVPAGFTFAQADNPTWTGPNLATPGPITVTHTMTTPIAPGGSNPVTINLRPINIMSSSDVDYTNTAEITSVQAGPGSTGAGSEVPIGTDITLDDIDSTPDNIPTNDPGANGTNAGSPADDIITGNGMGTQGDGVAATDEDDTDPAKVRVVDLALTKVIDPGQTPAYGQPLNFTISVTNQGTEAVNQVVVSDYVPAGYSYVDANNPDWTGADGAGPMTITSTSITTLAIDQTLTIPLQLVLEQQVPANPDAWTNVAEISMISDTNDIDVSLFEADSTPDTNPTNDEGGELNSPADNAVDGDGTGTGGPTDPSTDEDDSDPAAPRIIDIALAKTTTATGPFSYGQQVTFDITVTNQGNEPLYNIDIVDYIPDGFDYGSGNFPMWSAYDIGSHRAIATIAGPLAPGASTSIPINLDVRYTMDAATGYDNYAEVYDMEDDMMVSLKDDDIDSVADSVDNNDEGGTPESDEDDHIDDDSMDSDGDGILDQDDHDPERIEIFDLALAKTLITPAPYFYGQLVEFNIQVCNQGNIGAKNITINEYIPAGYSFQFGNQNSMNWGGTTAAPTYNTGNNDTLMVDACWDIPVFLTVLMTTGGEKDWINYAEIASADNEDDANRDNWDIDSNPGSDTATENAVEPGDTEDNDLESSDKGGEEDDHDPAGIEIFDLAIQMLDDTGVLANYGDDVTFDIEITNQGSITSAGVTVTNYIPSGYVFNAVDNDSDWVDNMDGTVSFTYPADITPGEVVDLELILEAVPTKEEGGYINVIEISTDNSVDPNVTDDIDSNPDAIDDNDSGGAVETASDDTINGVGIDAMGNPTGAPGDTDPTTDEDDSDPETIIVYDMALYKTMVTQGPFQYGEVHEFEICVVNQGTEIMQNVDIMDYVPNGYTYEAINNTMPSWSPVAGGVTTTIAGPFDPCDTLCVSLFLTFDQTTGGAGDWINYAEITEMEDMQGPVADVDSTPESNGPGETNVLPGDPADDDTSSNDKGGEEDDHDPAGPAVFDLAVQMLDDTDVLTDYGDDVTFPIEVTNQGNVTSNGFTVTNYVPSGYVFNLSDNSGWVNNGNGTVSYTYPADVVPGEVVPLTLVLEAQPTKEENGWVNIIEISNDNSANPNAPTDIDSNPDTIDDNDSGGLVESPSDDTIDGVGIDKNGNPTGTPGDNVAGNDEDDHDPETIRVFDLALYKNVTTPGPHKYGDIIDFEVCVINQGSETVSNVTISDHIPAGYILAPGNAGWYPDGVDTYSFDLVGDMIACDTICETISLILQMTTGDYRDWINYGEVKSFTDENGMPAEDVDSTPDSNGPDELAVEPGDPNDNNVNSIDEGGEEDDHDPAGIDIFDLALRKTIVSTGPSFSYGETVQYQIEIFNQGNMDATDIVVVDSLPCGLEFDTSSGINTANGWNYDPSTRQATMTYNGVITPGTSQPFFIESTVVPCYENESLAWTNYSDLEGWDDTDPATANPPLDIDSEAGGNNVGGSPNNPNEDNVINGVGDCNNCLQTVTVPLDVMIPSIVEAVNINGGILPLPNYPYNINNPVEAALFLSDCLALGYVVNTQLIGNNVEMTVVYPGVTFESVSLNNGKSYGFTCHTCIGPLSDEDDHDPAQIEVFDLALQKVAQDRGPFDIGDAVAFDITVYNQGNVPATEIVINDFMRTGFLFQGANPGWSNNGGLLNYTISDVIAPGDSTVITLNLVTALDADPSAEDWWNYAEIASAQDDNDQDRSGDDADSTPDTDSPYENNVEPDDTWDNVTDGQGFSEGEDEDDHDPAKVIVVGGLGDTVWKDLNGNGIQDNNEPGVPNVIARLYDCNGQFINSTATDINGFYFFDNLVPGFYNVEFDLSAQPPGCDFTYQDQGNNDELDSDVGFDGIAPCTFISGGEYDSTFDAGLIPLASLGDFVWHDLDGDGVQDGNEPPIQGVHVHLYDGQGNYIESTLTDANGEYLFDLLYPGEYYVQFESKDPDFMITFPNEGFDDSKDSDVDDSNGPGTTTITTLDPGENDPDWDAGFYKCVPIGELVWYDITENDVWDVFENGINGINVRLMRWTNGAWSEWDSAYTGHKPGTPSDDGYFKFCAPPGTYHLAIDFPAMGLVPAVPHVGGNENTDSDVDNGNGFQTTSSFTVLSGDEKCDIGAGYYPMAQVGNRVWNDINGDGLQSAGEPIVQNVIVEAYDIYGSKVGEDITNAAGVYNIDYLGKDDYYMKFTPPAGYVATLANMGDDMMDSDIDGSNGYNTTDFISLNPGDEIISVDAGLVLGVVPVEWESFTAEHKGTHNALEWITASEQNTSHFIVQRRLENEDSFSDIGQVQAAGLSSEKRTYNYDDLDIEFKGTYYYRIKQLDTNGSFSYTDVRNVTIETGRENSINLYPNPAIDKVEVALYTSEGSEAKVSIWDVDGRLVRDNIVNNYITKGSHTISIDISNLAGGIYNLKVSVGNKVTNKSLIVVRD